MPLPRFRRSAEGDRPYSLPSRLPAHLDRLRAYWLGLRRGEAEMPFADDFNPLDLPDLADSLLLIDAFEQPLRFRLQTLGAALKADDLTGRFLDEIRLAPPLEFLASQCNATVETGAPSYFRGGSDRPRRRLLLPFWGEGRISLIVGAIE